MWPSAKDAAAVCELLVAASEMSVGWLMLFTWMTVAGRVLHMVRRTGTFSGEGNLGGLSRMELQQGGLGEDQS